MHAFCRYGEVVGGEESSSILADRARAATNSYSPWLDYEGQWAPVAGELTGRRVAVAGELLPVREYLYVWKKRKKILNYPLVLRESLREEQVVPPKHSNKVLNLLCYLVLVYIKL